ncbi:MAG TPA: ATP-binding cassette domain-containing protein [Alphaproteobacteria bacterium]
MVNAVRSAPERPFLVAVPPAVAVAALLFYTASNAHGVRLATLAGIYALLVIGYQFVFGRLGALSLAQGAFFGLGAFVTARLGLADLPFLITFPAAIALPALVAALVVGPVLRLQSYYVPLVTLGLAQMLFIAALSSGDIAGVPTIMFLPGLELPRGPAFAIFVWVLAIVGALIAWSLSATHFGRFAEVVRDNPVAAGAVGLDAGRMRLQGFVLSAAYGGGAGALHAHLTGVVSPADFSLPVMIMCLAMATVGGRRHVTGGIVGVVLLNLAVEAAGLSPLYQPIFYGLMVLIALYWLPDGVLGLLERRFAPLSVVVSPAPQAIPARKAARIAGPLLAVRGITRRFGGVIAVDNVSLALHPGEILGMIGPNGSGKTTLLNALSGLSPAQTGRIFLSGRDITNLAPHEVARVGLARSFQTAQLADRLSALDNVAAARAALNGLDFGAIVQRARAETAFARARAEAMACLDIVNLVAAAATPASQLVPADRRRLEIARALALDPLVVAFDEPAAGLDADERDALAALLKQLAARGLGLIVVEHEVAFLRGIATRLACMDAGRLIAIGPPEIVMADPKVAAAYLGAGAVGGGRIK